MDQIIEFVGNHPLLFVAFFATLGMLVYTEYMRIAGSSAQLSPFAATQLMNDGDTIVVDVRDENEYKNCLLYTSPSPRDATLSRMPSSA